MPVDVGDDVAEALVVEADRLGWGVEGAVHGGRDLAHVLPEAGGSVGGEEAEVLGVVGEPQRAPARVALVHVEQERGFAKVGDEEGVEAFTDAGEAGAGTAAGGNRHGALLHLRARRDLDGRTRVGTLVHG